MVVSLIIGFQYFIIYQFQYIYITLKTKVLYEDKRNNFKYTN